MMVMKKSAVVLSALVLGLPVLAGLAQDNQKDRVVIVPAHPDDLIACLGFCHLAKGVYDIHVIDFTHGERGLGYVNYTNGVARAKRTQEEEAVCASIGATLHWLDEIDGEAYARPETCRKLAKLIGEIRPRAVIGHWPSDIHTDHVMAGAAMLRAVFLSGVKPEVWFFEEPYQAKGLVPDALVDVSSVMDEIFKSLRLYACQNQGGGLEREQRLVRRFRGMQSRNYYKGECEAYKAMIPPMQGVRTIFSDLPSPKGATRGFEFEGARESTPMPHLPDLGAVAPTGPALAGEPDVRLLEELVAIPSVSRDIPQVNRAQRHLKAWLEAKGVACTLETMPDGHELVFASTRPGKEQDYVLAAHLDVVPGEPAQFKPRREGDRLVGRGACDCKGPCVAVAEALVRLNGKASVGVIFGADEEIGGVTTRWMVERGYRPRKMAIVTDSAWNAVTYAQKGHTYFTVTAKGKGGHSSRPWDSQDSIKRICEAYLKLRAAWDAAHPLPADKWGDVLSATFLKADGGAFNRIPDEASFLVNLRGVSADSADRAEAFIREVTGLEVVRGEDSKPFATDPNHPELIRLQAVMRKHYAGEKVPLQRMNAATDARCFYDCGTPVAVIGVRGHGAHATDEWESLSSIVRVTDMLVDFLKGE